LYLTETAAAGISAAAALVLLLPLLASSLSLLKVADVNEKFPRQEHEQAVAGHMYV
jgi:hypothetical protein